MAIVCCHRPSGKSKSVQVSMIRFQIPHVRLFVPVFSKFKKVSKSHLRAQQSFRGALSIQYMHVTYAFHMFLSQLLHRRAPKSNSTDEGEEHLLQQLL